MNAANTITNRWFSRIAGVAFVAIGIAGLAVPSPTAALQRATNKAMTELKPFVQKTEFGRQILAVYHEHGRECQRSL